jgi:hypothetical protein
MQASMKSSLLCWFINGEMKLLYLKGNFAVLLERPDLYYLLVFSSYDVLRGKLRYTLVYGRN